MEGIIITAPRRYKTLSLFGKYFSKLKIHEIHRINRAKPTPSNFIKTCFANNKFTANKESLSF
jgi:hypothetical protein